MKKELDKEVYLVTYDNEAFCSGADRNETSPSMLVESEIMMYQLKALKSWLDEDQESTENYLKKTIELENGLSYSYGPPVIQKPTHELYADWLFKVNRADEALQQYELTLKRAPKRRKAVQGITKIQKA